MEHSTSQEQDSGERGRLSLLEWYWNRHIEQNLKDANVAIRVSTLPTRGKIYYFEDELVYVMGGLLRASWNIHDVQEPPPYRYVLYTGTRDTDGKFVFLNEDGNPVMEPCPLDVYAETPLRRIWRGVAETTIHAEPPTPDGFSQFLSNKFILHRLSREDDEIVLSGFDMADAIDVVQEQTDRIRAYER